MSGPLPFGALSGSIEALLVGYFSLVDVTSVLVNMAST